MGKQVEARPCYWRGHTDESKKRRSSEAEVSASKRQRKAGGAKEWLYKDPKNCVQGPFSSTKMAAWFKAGYFTKDTMVRRIDIEGSEFEPVGENSLFK